MAKRTVKDIELKGKKVLVRCDFNVPMNENKEITDNRRIKESLETINYLIEKDAKIILVSHLGRPNGKVNMEFSLSPIAKELSRLLNKDIKLAKDIVGENAKQLIKKMKNGEIVLLENVRFDKREEENSDEFSKELASLAEIYVNDAFGTVHRAHSSTSGIAKYIPAVSGLLIEKELKFLGNALENPKRPFVAILGGAKVSDKIRVIDVLLEKVDTLIIGGGMAYTFFKAMGYNVGNSICELDKLDFVNEALKKARINGVKVMLPVDNIVAQKLEKDVPTKLVKYTQIPDGWEGLDIGIETIKLYEEEIKSAKTIIWNGPLGYSEFEIFANGTNSIAKCVASLKDAVTIIGGGDSAAAIVRIGLEDKITHISTGGGATLEYLEGKKLPGIECLLEK